MRTVSWSRLVCAAAVAAVLPAALWVVVARACGPDFEPEVFVPAHGPESPHLYAAGQLGVVQGGYYHAALVVAYRYLSGGRLTEAEQTAYAPTQAVDEGSGFYEWDQRHEDSTKAAIQAWQAAKASVGASPTTVTEDRAVEQKIGNYTYQGTQLNCTDGALLTAANTLQARAAAWGAGSSPLKEWLRGQDAVFSNCAGTGMAPDAAQTKWPLLLQQDRAYQLGAAALYAGRFDDAIAAFVSIGRDAASPWSRWGEYLAARAEVRKASQTGKTADMGEKATFDEPTLRAAHARLLKLLESTRDVEVHHAAQAELNFIEVRLEPGKRLDAAGNALAMRDGDPDFAQDLTDLDWLIGGTAGSSDLVQWIEAMRGTPSKTAAEHWQDTRSVPWLVAGLTQGAVAGPSEEMLRAAAEVAPGSAAYQTVSFYRAGRMIAQGRQAEARPLLTSILAGMPSKATASTRNQFLSERIQTARTLTEFLADAPRTTVVYGSSASGMAQCAVARAGKDGACNGKLPGVEFDADAAGYMDRQMPLSMLEEAAESTALPAHLRRAVAEIAWVRALGLGDETAVRRMSPLLPEPIRAVAGDSHGFPATLAMLRNPGLKPFLEAGVQRSASYAEMDHFRDNWWCGRWSDGVSSANGDGTKPLPETPLKFITATDARLAAEQNARLNREPSGLVWTARRAIAYVKAHPDDTQAAETLALVVQGTHWGCDFSYGAKDAISPQRAVSKEAFELLHRLYPKSEWALKTKYYY